MISENLNRLNKTITETAERCGRKRSEIKLIAVSKKFPVDKIHEAYDAGQLYFGENYVQEIVDKVPEAPAEAKFHFIGNLQSNKAKIAAELCDMVETVDREKLGQILNKHCAAVGKTLQVLVQVNIGDDPNKSGVKKEEAAGLMEGLRQFPHLHVCGLMTIPPFSNTPEESRHYFRGLRQLRDKLQKSGYFPEESVPELSMGMSGDFQVAIEEGATIIRVGTAIFGQRLA